MTIQARSLIICCFLCGPIMTVAQTAQIKLTAGKDNISDVKAAMKPSADQAAQLVVDRNIAAPAGQPQLDIGPIVRAYYIAIANTSAQKPLATATETARSDKQIGTSSSAATGSTSVVDRPGIPELLGFALEHGAITQQVQENTVTFSTSPYAIAAWLSGGDTAENYARFGNTYGRIGFSANFNLSDITNPVLSAKRKQLNEWSAKIRLWTDHSGRSQDAKDAFNRH